MEEAAAPSSHKEDKQTLPCFLGPIAGILDAMCDVASSVLEPVNSLADTRLCAGGLTWQVWGAGMSLELLA